MKYIIGLDLGINNVGWSVVNEETNELDSYGVKKFTESSGASDRRGIRNSRRRLKRKDTRKKDLLYILDSINFPNNLTVDTKLIETRCKSIKEKVSKQDITNILCFMVTHRGYIPFGDEEVNFVELNKKFPCEYYYDKFINSKNNKYRALRETVTNKELEYELRKMIEIQRNFYPELNEEIEEKIVGIFNRKRKFWQGPGSINSITEYGRFKSTEDVLEYQKNKENNPNYEKYIYEDLIGRCQVDPKEKCAPKGNFYAEKFNLLNDFINVSFKNIDEVSNKDCFNLAHNGLYKLNEKGLNLVFAYCLDKDTIQIKKIFKDLFATDIQNLSGFRQEKHDPNKPEMSTMNIYRSVRKIYKDSKANMDMFSIENIDIYNKIMECMILVPGQVELINMVSSFIELPKNDKDALKKTYETLKKSQRLSYHSLSEKVLIMACNDMLSLEKNYMTVSKIKDYEKKSRKMFIEKYKTKNNGKLQMNPTFIDDIVASPQVKKTLRQAEKIINEIIKDKKELPATIVVESTKEEMSGKEKRNEYIKFNKKQKNLHDEAEKLLSSLGYTNINKKTLTKVILYKEMNGQCPYCNKPIDIKYLINGSGEIEHILPRSDSFDDSQDNRTISCAECNDKKESRTPLQFLKGTDRETFIKRIKDNKNINENKKSNFLFEGDISKYQTRFFNRNLRDTAYATTELIKQINIFNYYLEALGIDNKIKTLSTPGQLTHAIRDRYDSLEKDREAGDVPFHHAVDASIIALLPTTSIGKEIMYYQNNPKFFIEKESKKKMKEIGYKLWHYQEKDKKTEYDEYIKELKLINDKDPNFRYSTEVSKEPNKQLFNANLYKVIKKDDNYFKIEQINDIYDAKINKDLLAKLFDDSKNETLLCHDQHQEFYNKLKAIYEKYKGSEISPFEEYQREIHNLSKEDTFDYLKHGIKMSENGPVVKKLRYYTPISEPFFLNKDSINKKDNTYLAYDSLAQVGIEVYHNKTKNRYAFVPIPAVCVNLKTRKLNKEHELYLRYKKNNLGEDEVEYVVTLYNGNTIEVYKPKGEVIISEVSCYHKTNDKIVLKNGGYFTKSDKGFSILDYNAIGKCRKRLTDTIE